MFHCLVIKVVRCQLFATACLLYHIFQALSRTFFKSFWGFQIFLKLFVSVVLFKRLGYFIISSVDCQQLIWIFWKLIYFSVFQKQFLATACLIYHRCKEKSSTFCKNFHLLFTKTYNYFCTTWNIQKLIKSEKDYETLPRPFSPYLMFINILSSIFFHSAVFHFMLM